MSSTMNFSSLKEYFYRLYNACLLRLLITIGVFLVIYYLSLSGSISPYIREESLVDFLRFTYLVLILITLTIVHLEVYKRLKHHSQLVGLGKKLDHYYLIVKTRMKTITGISLFLAAGLLFTGHEWFTIYFGGMIGWFLFQWPTPRTVSRQLKLKGDERTMVITKGDAFEF
ncbi:MAG TPA: hypothetical protein VGQ59_15680 [Cyclobacteriaceae bacterium]|nr:hypothetical protein [Cyclobacteriaceae bacterium]